MQAYEIVVSDEASLGAYRRESQWSGPEASEWENEDGTPFFADVFGSVAFDDEADYDIGTTLYGVSVQSYHVDFQTFGSTSEEAVRAFALSELQQHDIVNAQIPQLGNKPFFNKTYRKGDNEVTVFIVKGTFRGNRPQ